MEKGRFYVKILQYFCKMCPSFFGMALKEWIIFAQVSSNVSHRSGLSQVSYHHNFFPYLVLKMKNAEPDEF